MNLKRAIWIGVAAYAISFVIGTIIAAIVGVDLTTAPTVPDVVWQISMVLGFVIYALAGYWYFTGNVNVSGREGAFVGLTFIITGFVLEMLLVIPFILFSAAASDILGYYAHPLLYISLLLIFVAPVLVGHLEEKQ